jgi:fructokinase
MKDNKVQNVVCFGEVLWDNLPTGKKPGGAPMNVAYHLKQLGLNSKVISRVGDDENGRELLKVIEGLNLETDYLQIDDRHKTSTVEVTLTENNEVAYDIVFPVAWDFISYEDKCKALVKQADAFVFGSLASRNDESRLTLMKLLDEATYKVFDVNLRPPHFDKKLIQNLLSKTDLLKINSDELTVIASWYSENAKTEEEQIQAINEALNINEIILTKGSKGAKLFGNSTVFYAPALAVKVADTVGSGDSFLAGFLSKKLTGFSVNDSLEFASNLAAFVTSSSGACPPYSSIKIEDYVKQLLSKEK